jgi:hypothetical protein
LLWESTVAGAKRTANKPWGTYPKAPGSSPLTSSYEMIIWWSDEAAAYAVEVPELPGCMAHGKTRPEADQACSMPIPLNAFEYATFDERT